MSNNKKKKAWAENGLEDWGSYMAAKKEKLEDQFQEAAEKEFQDATSLFSGIAIFVNGYTNPCADELKRLMMANGGVYHHYMRSRITTHIIASNLPYSKIVAYRKSQNPLPICKPEWITDSLRAQKLLDWRPYVLYSNCTKTQPQLQFHEKPSSGHSLFATEKPKSKPTESPREKAKIFGTLASEDRIESDGKLSSSSNKSINAPMSTKNAEFLSEFYSNSRLHHISTMGATFKDYVNELRSKSDGKFSGLARLKRIHEGKKSRSKVLNESDSEDDLFGSPSTEIKTKSVNDPVIMHIDMDCFFVSVGLRNKPELRGLPVAVTHARGNRQTSRAASENGNTDEEYGSMSEVASCSYEARKAGVKNGMFLGQALKLCPDLKTIQYDFDGYKEVSYALYDTLSSYTLLIEAVSCDEMYVDVTNVLRETSLSPLEFATIIRNEIKEKTGCPVSTGFGCNKLQARLATRKAKPDGQFYLDSKQFGKYVGSMVVSDLPGVGYSTMHSLKKMNVRTCSDLYDISLSVLQKEFGKKTGEMLHNMCRGIDNSKLTVEHVRKSVSAEVNYGIRFENPNEADDFLRKLSQEVCTRLQRANAKGRSLTLKLMVRAKDAPKEALKFMGHGICDNFTKSKNLIAPVDDPVIITREVISLWNQMQQPYEDVRGIGIQISRLESSNTRSTGIMMNFINKSKQPDVKSTAEEKSNDEKVTKAISEDVKMTNKSEKICRPNQETKEPKLGGLEAFFVKKSKITSERDDSAAKKVCSTNIEGIDENVLAELPEEIRNEILESCGSKHGEKTSTSSIDSEKMKNNQPSDSSTRSEENKSNMPIIPSQQITQSSDYDESVLKELPEEIRNEILGTKELSSEREQRKVTKSYQTHQEKYFKHAKSTSGKTTKTQMPPIEQIDMSVLIELPEDIRNEIINEYKAKKDDQKRENDMEQDKNIETSRFTTEQRNDRPKEHTVIRDEANLSFSQVDPEFLAALSEDIKADVEMYCMVKKREKTAKQTKPSSEANAGATNLMANNRNSTKSSKKNSRLPKTRNKIIASGAKRTIDRQVVQHSVDATRKKERATIEEERTSRRFLDSDLDSDVKISGSFEQREEIISHHTSFTGKKARTEEQEMLTNLVNYLFTLPLQQVRMQIQTWISKSKDVNEIDLLSLATFLSMLPKKKRLEDLHIFLKTMHRCITKTGSCVWHETYRRTVFHVQHYMQIEYNSKMMLPTINCDHCDCETNLIV